MRKLSASYKIDILRLGISIAVPLIAGVIGSIFTSQSVSTWFQTIEKPSFSPPNWLFGPVWTTLYVLLCLSFVCCLSSSLDAKESLHISHEKLADTPGVDSSDLLAEAAASLAAAAVPL